MKFWNIILCFAVIIGSVFSGMYIHERNNKVSRFYGEYAQEANTLFNAHTKSLTFEQKDGRYIVTTEWDKTFNYDGTKHEYDLLINKSICSIVDDGAGYLRAELDKSFQSTANETLLRDTLYVNIDFLSSRTVLTVYTEGDNTAMSYWVEFVNSYGLDLKVIQLDAEVQNVEK